MKQALLILLAGVGLAVTAYAALILALQIWGYILGYGWIWPWT